MAAKRAKNKMISPLKIIKQTTQKKTTTSHSLSNHPLPKHPFSKSPAGNIIIQYVCNLVCNAFWHLKLNNMY